MSDEGKNRHTWRVSYMRAMGALKTGRKRAGLTQDDAAAHIDMPLRTFQRHEAGERELAVEEFFKLADAVGLEIVVQERTR